jgi:hypothetical protein
MQIHDSSKMYKSMFDCARYVYRSEGVSAFYVSYPTTLSMTVPFTALQFLAYESISTAMNPTKVYDPLTHCSAGAVAGGFAAALTTPMDVVKTMLQTRGTASDTELRNVNGFMEGCRLLHRREGFRGFFKGVRPRVVTTMPSTAICWSAYEACKWVLRNGFGGEGFSNMIIRAYFIRQNDTVVWKYPGVTTRPTTDMRIYCHLQDVATLKSYSNTLSTSWSQEESSTSCSLHPPVDILLDISTIITHDLALLSRAYSQGLCV